MHDVKRAHTPLFAHPFCTTIVSHFLPFPSNLSLLTFPTSLLLFFLSLPPSFYLSLPLPSLSLSLSLSQGWCHSLFVCHPENASQGTLWLPNSRRAITETILLYRRLIVPQKYTSGASSALPLPHPICKCSLYKHVNILTWTKRHEWLWVNRVITHSWVITKCAMIFIALDLYALIEMPTKEE